MDYYGILGVLPSASDLEIKSAFRAKILEIHPDKNLHRDTTKEFQILSEAYSVLKDPSLRRDYDKKLRENSSKNREKNSTRFPQKNSKFSVEVEEDENENEFPEFRGGSFTFFRSRGFSSDPFAPLFSSFFEDPFFAEDPILQTFFANSPFFSRMQPHVTSPKISERSRENQSSALNDRSRALPSERSRDFLQEDFLISRDSMLQRHMAISAHMESVMRHHEEVMHSMMGLTFGTRPTQTFKRTHKPAKSSKPYRIPIN